MNRTDHYSGDSRTLSTEERMLVASYQFDDDEPKIAVDFAAGYRSVTSVNLYLTPVDALALRDELSLALDALPVGVL